MLSTSHLVTIIVPFFNSERFMKETLDTVRAQSYRHFECLMIDDGSTDTSAEIAQDFQRRDPRFRYIYDEHKPRGVSASRNMGMQLANGAWVMFLDSDDLLEIDTLARRVEVMLRDPRLQISVFQVQAFGFESFTFTREMDDYLHAFIEFDFQFQTSSVFWEIEFARSVGTFRTDMTNLEDPEFHMRALAMKPRMVVLPYPDPDVRYRVWKYRSAALSDALVSELRCYLKYIESAIKVAKECGYDTRLIRNGLQLMIMRTRWAYNSDIRSLLGRTIEISGEHGVISASSTHRLMTLLNRVSTSNPHPVLELMAFLVHPTSHIKAYLHTIKQRFS